MHSNNASHNNKCFTVFALTDVKIINLLNILNNVFEYTHKLNNKLIR